MGRPRGRHLSAYTKLGIQWLDPSSVAQQTARVATHALHAISLAQPPPTGRVAAVRVGTGVPYVMIEARLKADAFDDGIPKEGVIVYAVHPTAWVIA